jgi:hypothetical protein
VALELPEGLGTSDGASRILADVWFAPEGGADSLHLEGAESLRRVLSTVSKVAAPRLAEVRVERHQPARDAPQIKPVEQVPVLAARRAQVAGRTTRMPPAPAARQVPASPAQHAEVRRKASSIAANLPALERHQAILYNQSYLAADERKRSALIRTRRTFFEKLARCSSDECRRDTYLSHNLEIVAIMRG